MISVCKIAVFCATVLVTVWAIPQNDKQPSFGDLKYTFGNKEEVPAAFFNSEPLKTGNASRSSTSPSPTATTLPKAETEQRKPYPPCQDGSGGMCVDAGSCPSNLRPETSEPGACASGQECCFGAPTTDRSCGSRGGECMPKGQCGSAPIFQDAQDCDQKSGQICCILI